jgi:drug/metabolite transporter (DMT)-like permease
MSFPWPAYALGAIACNGLQDLTDKRAMRGHLDGAVATFIRVGLYVLLVLPLMALMGHPLTWYCTPAVMGFGVLNTGMSSAYTLLLRRIHISTLAILAYVAPLIFLVIDHFLGQVHTLWQIGAIVGLVAGGMLFVLDERPQFDRLTLVALLWTVGCGGAEAYYVKSVHATEGLDVIVVLANIWVWVSLFLLAFLVVTGRVRHLVTRAAWTYARWSVLGKSFDVMASYLWSVGVALTTLAQFAAMEAFFPPILLLLVWLVQGVFRVDLGETLTRAALLRKSAAAGLLVVSSLFV